MKIKIGNTIFSPENTPIMIILSQAEKEQIANMPGEKYCQYPQTKDPKEIKEWMEDEKE